ncbi:MAG TPA: glycosyltransferase family 87 protein [Candidatus Dormibacteraeota bacterium]|nr:glycosyltransferase family 87 protein [Candidatus Dormibacteraeota bacterium]
MPPVLRRVLARPLLWWLIAAVFFVHDVVGNLYSAHRPDAFSVIQAGGRWLHDPGAIYAETARHLAQTGFVPIIGLIRPPAVAMLGAPFSLLPTSWQEPAFTLVDALAALAALLIVERHATRAPLERAVFWAIALYAPPLFAEINAGQIGGFVLILACGAMVTIRGRPGLSGALVAAASSLKLYPALMVLGARKRWPPFVIAAVIAGVLINLVAILPLGLGGAWSYVTAVLIPSLKAPNPDCAQTSVVTLFGRSIGGDPYPMINSSGGITMFHSPLHLGVVATVLTAITLVAVVVGAVLGARASGWNPVYGAALGLGLGAILPGEVNPYQYLPLMPLALMVTVAALRKRSWRLLVPVAAGLLTWLQQPCYLPFPNLWTIGALLIFAACIAAADEFRSEATR